MLPAASVVDFLRDQLDLTAGEFGGLVAAAIATVAWLLVVAAIRAVRQPREPAGETPTLDLGPEPPALANMLASGFKVTPDAVPATLLDLAARHVVEIERVDVDTYQCRLRAAGDGASTPYEGRVLELLRERAHDGIVPAQALTTGPSEHAARWWKGFAGEVVADAQSRGLSRDLWSREVITGLGVVAAVPALLYGIPFGLKGIGICALGAGVLLGGIRSRRRQRDTPDGLVAAGRWVAVREKLEEDEVFPMQPPITVALWERLLAYGAALGVAAGAVRPIPMGAESDKRAWSAFGGRWHQVTVRYPRLYPPAWGLHPVAALLWAALFGGIALLFLYFVSSVISDLGDVGALGLLIVLAVVLVPLGVVAGAVLMIVKAGATSPPTGRSPERSSACARTARTSSSAITWPSTTAPRRPFVPGA